MAGSAVAAGRLCGSRGAAMTPAVTAAASAYARISEVPFGKGGDGMAAADSSSDEEQVAEDTATFKHFEKETAAHCIAPCPPQHFHAKWRTKCVSASLYLYDDRRPNFRTQSRN